ncbi:MAG: hypothetical protein MI749_10990 [Desulfovibrionales bacterium]|nr:hypothetical protein [Desulfovibrionales bacterium]
MEKESLIHKYLPRYSFREYHEILVDAPIDKVYEEAWDFDLSKSKTISLLFKLRGLPTKHLNLQNFIGDIGFTNLEARPPHENLIGFWVRTKILPIPSHGAFINNSVSPWTKAVWNFQFEEEDSSQTRVSTETRILCVSPISKISFRLYWWIIKPFSGLIRKKMLSIIKDGAEKRV